MDEAFFINGPQVKIFQKNLENYLAAGHVIPCANGTDALQIAMMALDLQPGDEVIIPAFTYVATAEVIALLQLVPVMVDVHEEDFNIDVSKIEAAIGPKTKVIVPVHLFGQSADMEGIMSLAKKHNLYVIEDNAQALGGDYYFADGKKSKTGTIGHIGCTSFFPSKSLGAYGDGGAIMSQDAEIAKRISMMANHGQSIKYVHDTIGCNSRLDTIQAAILDVKLKYLDAYRDARNKVADQYDHALSNIADISIPVRSAHSNHVFHQYTLRVRDGRRDDLKKYLEEKGVPSMIYYPIPLYRQKAYSKYVEAGFGLRVTEAHCKEVLSLPIHTEMSENDVDFIIKHVESYFR